MRVENTMFSVVIMSPLERNKEYEKQRDEERLSKFGCPVQRAERNFFETVS